MAVQIIALCVEAALTRHPVPLMHCAEILLIPAGLECGSVYPKAFMRDETLALHAGFDADPATRAVAVPIYQTAAYQFDSADQGAALFNLEEEGYRYSRIANPTVTVLEDRVAALEGAAGALATASGQAALYYALANVAQAGQNIVSTPQLYGTTHTLLAQRAARPGRGRAALPPATAPRRWPPASTKIPARCSARRWAIRPAIFAISQPLPAWRMPMAFR